MWFKAKVISSPSTLVCRERKIAPALFNRTSSRDVLSLTCSASLRTSLCDERSAMK